MNHQQQGINHYFSTAFGDPRVFPLEHRLVSAIALLNGILNLLGTLGAASLPNSHVLIPLHLLFGVLFLGIYYLARIQGLFTLTRWPFLVLIAAFLSINVLWNAGSSGGAHYYLIPGLVIGVVVSPSLPKKLTALGFFLAVSGSLFLVENFAPEMIHGYSDPSAERWSDVFGNFLFVQIFTGAVVMLLARNLEEERLKSDRLLLNILPESIADELKKTDRVVPLHYESATVIFTDFVGFTHSAESMTPQSLVQELDECFRAFDDVMQRHGLEKIKTIGDAYMAAGGIPKPNASHAIDCVNAALEIRDYMAEQKRRRQTDQQPFWELRLGIHTGPLVAGVVGTNKFVYDVWGDTVNTAARMEASGLAGKVNISSATHDLIKTHFRCEHRGRIAAKNKGDIDMYIVEARTPSKTANS